MLPNNLKILNSYKYFFIAIISFPVFLSCVKNKEEVFSSALVQYENNNLDEAIRLFEEAGELGNGRAYWNLFVIFLYGDSHNSLAPDTTKAISYLKKGKKLKDEKSCIALGDAFLYGIGVKEDLLEAESCYKLVASDSLISMAMIGRALIYCQPNWGKNGPEYDKSEKLLASAIEADPENPLPYYFMGVLSNWQCDQTADEKNAFDFFSKAAMLNYVPAYCELAWLYRDGEFEDQAKALEYFQKASDSGFPPAYHGLACMYLDGEGVDQDYVKAFKYFKEAADNNYDPACFYVAHMYREGLGTVKNLESAYRYYYKAATLGNKEGMFAVAKCYKDGIGVKANEKKADFWTLKAAEIDARERNVIPNNKTLYLRKKDGTLIYLGR